LERSLAAVPEPWAEPQDSYPLWWKLALAVDQRWKLELELDAPT
jgi:hypothetical protein